MAKATNIGKIALFTVMCFFITGCSFFYPNSVLAEPTRYSAWLVYWDMEAGERDLSELGGKLEAVVGFAAYFDANGKLFVPQQILTHKQSLKKNKYKTYLTFVNDQEVEDGKVLSKDIELLKKLFATDISMQEHIEEIIGIAKQYGYDGIEIDYERIWVDPEVGQAFTVFANKLAYQAIRNNLELRIVLEPGIPFDKTDFAKGPEYVVMLYNLYGTHSGPGPKADKKFIERTIKKMQVLPGRKAVAFSVGGCLWGNDGTKQFITQEQAEQLIKRYKPATVDRDNASGVLHFTYESFGIKYTVWYADIKTLNEWVKTAKLMGIADISIWRLGGNIGLNDLI